MISQLAFYSGVRAVWRDISKEMSHIFAKLDLAWNFIALSPNLQNLTLSSPEPCANFRKWRKVQRRRNLWSSVSPSLRFSMTGRGGGGGRRVLLPPINFIFKLLQQHSTVQIWLYEQLAIRIEGKIRVGVCCRNLSDLPYWPFVIGFWRIYESCDWRCGGS